jgi:hypothetical protein
MNNESRFPSNWGTVFLFSFSFISMPNTFIFQRIPTEFKVDFQYALAINNAQFIFMLVIWGGIRHLSLRRTPESTKMARYRLRKRLELSNEESLGQFVTGFE